MTWREKALRDLDAGCDSVVPTYAFGKILMAELVRSGIYEAGLPPEACDCIVLDTDSGPSEFIVYEIQKRILCEEHGNAKKREFWFNQWEELRWHTINRQAFYALMAVDFGVAGSVVRLDRGVWEIGRKNIPGYGRAKIIFVEQGVGENDLVACLVRHGFKTNCLLFHGKPPAQISVPEKSVVASSVLVMDGRFVTLVFDDLAASRSESVPETGVDLDSTPQKLVICGEDFPMPLHKGNPLIGLKYFAVLFDRAREVIPVWDLFVAAKPGLSDPDADVSNEGDEEDPTDTDQVSTGIKRSDNRPSIRPGWEDDTMDSETRKIVGQDLAKKRKRLESLTKQGVQTGSEVRNLKKEVSELQAYMDAGKGAGGRKRAIKHGDRDKARDSVRGGIGVVIQHVAKQNPTRAEELRNSLDLGYDVMFKPPPEWGI